MQTYEVLIEKISKASGLSLSEIEGKVKAKKEKLSGLISKEGAAQIIAAELGISFEDQNLKVNEVVPGMRRVNIVGKILTIFPVREYAKEGRKGKVVNMIIADNTGSTKIVLWDTNHISLIEGETISKGDVIEVKNASAKENEIHLSSFSEFKKSSVVIVDVKTTDKEATPGKLDEARQGQSLKVRGVVVQIFMPRFYYVCPECNKKAGLEGEKYKCNEHGIIMPKERAILNFVIDDGFENMRVVMFSDQINSIIAEGDLKIEEKFNIFRDDFLGSEIYVSGRVSRNQLFNNLEIIATSTEKVNVEELIKELEAPQ